jgi:hypothetical protein
MRNTMKARKEGVTSSFHSNCSLKRLIMHYDATTAPALEVQ